MQARATAVARRWMAGHLARAFQKWAAETVYSRAKMFMQRSAVGHWQNSRLAMVCPVSDLTDFHNNFVLKICL
jgi:hypothetical protein